MEKSYAQALVSSLHKGVKEEALMTALMKQLKASGRLKLLPGILRELKTLRVREETLAPHVEVARESDAAMALKAAKEAGIDAQKAEVNPTLVAGWRARQGSTLVDRSAKDALITLYRRITT